MNRRIVCVCRSGARSARATETAQGLGLRRRQHDRRHEGLGRRPASPSSATTAPPARSSDQPVYPRCVSRPHGVGPGDALTCRGELRPRARRCAAWPTSSSTCSWSAAGSPASGSRSTPRPAGCAPRSSSATTSRRARRRSRRSSCTAGSATSSSARSASSTRRSPSARSSATTAPHLVRVLPFLLPVFTRDGLLPRRLARLLGTTMWTYDLTGGLRIGKLHQRVSKEEALRVHADAARRPRRGVVRVLRRPDRRRPPHARRSRAPPPTTAPRSPTTRGSSSFDKDADGHVRGARRRRRRADDRRAARTWS